MKKGFSWIKVVLVLGLLGEVLGERETTGKERLGQSRTRDITTVRGDRVRLSERRSLSLERQRDNRRELSFDRREARSSTRREVRGDDTRRQSLVRSTEHPRRESRDATDFRAVREQVRSSRVRNDAARRESLDVRRESLVRDDTTATRREFREKNNNRVDSRVREDSARREVREDAEMFRTSSLRQDGMRMSSRILSDKTPSLYEKEVGGGGWNSQWTSFVFGGAALLMLYTQNNAHTKKMAVD